MGKTDSIIDVVLSRLDQRPVPIIYAWARSHTSSPISSSRGSTMR